MNLKEFLKPNKLKIGLTILLFIVILYGWFFNDIIGLCYPEPGSAIGVDGFVYQFPSLPEPSDYGGFCIFSIPIILIYHVINGNYYAAINFVWITLVSYIISCAIIHWRNNSKQTISPNSGNPAKKIQ